ncbi:MAG: 6-pyruvoyl trahydropterin synthase family protein [Candidatus Thorarchaeota archaeon]|jgi:6-pyruvoyltetrahydropterin/6-carboxytetrahydropterin synthase
MITISKEYTFDSAHQLWNDWYTAKANQEVFGKCARLHGHTYKLTVQITGDVDPSTGMILNYFELDDLMKPYVDDVLDHQYLGGPKIEGVHSVFNFLTTAENMVNSIAELIMEILPDHVRLGYVKLQETPKTSAVWYNEA